MPFLIGAVLALAIGLVLTYVGLGRDRAFYPTVLIVIASYYVLFAVMGGSQRALLVECSILIVFFAASIVGYKQSLWIVAAAFMAHGVFDWFHGHIIVNSGVPVWWPQFCMAYDIVAAVYLAWLLRRQRCQTIDCSRGALP